MTRLLPGGALAACVVGVLDASPLEQPSFRDAGGLVRVFATVTDRNGELVTTLTRDAFEVRDRGERRPIAEFASTPLPLRLIVMLDVSASMEPNLAFLRLAAARLFARLGPDDFTSVGTFGHEITIAPWFTHHAETLRATLPRTIEPDAPSPLWRALDRALDAFGDERGARSVLLVLSDGADRDPSAVSERPSTPAALLDRARRDDVMIYAIGVRRAAARPGTAAVPALQPRLPDDVPDQDLRQIAEETGGRYIETRSEQDLSDAFAAVVDELHGQYLLGFAPDEQDGQLHAIDVYLSGAGLTLRARRGYVATTPQEQP